jgi:hypothetical protein
MDDVVREMKNNVYPVMKLNNNVIINMLLLADDMVM